MIRKVLGLGAALTCVAFLVGAVRGGAALTDPLDPVYGVPLPCELVSTSGTVPRSSKNMTHVANVCGFVGTDIEFQSRMDSTGKLHDYSFVGSMGAGLRIFDITDPTQPKFAGAYLDPGWEDDIQVRADVATVGFDPILVGINVSTCLKQKQPTGVTRGGFDLIDLNFAPATATFAPSLRDCYLNQAGGSHNSTFSPSGQWIASDTASTNGIEVVDLRGLTPTYVRTIPTAVSDEPHDIFFTADGNTLFDAGIRSTRIIDVSDIFNRAPTLTTTIPNIPAPDQNPDGQTIQISHQSETTADGKILVITDERGGGLSNTACNTGPSGVIGGAHFWALAPIPGIANSTGASLTMPKKIGTWIYPNPTLALDPIGRLDRACTIHMFRLGGNGTNTIGPVAPGFDGVSRLPINQLVTAHYGAGTWWLDFSGPPTSADGTVEDARTTWGNTRGWIIMPGADTWSTKEYKGFVYTGDMGRGFDVFAFQGGPTAVAVSAFTAVRTARGVRLSWRTGAESSLIGFNVYRGTVRVNHALVPARGANGAAYRLLDRRGSSGSSYRLQSVGLDGSRVWSATATVTR